MKKRKAEIATAFGITLLTAAMSGGCFRAEAKTPAVPPALETPEPPARLVYPVRLEAPPEPPAPTPTPTPTPKPTPAATSGRGASPPATPPVTTTPPTDPPTPPPVLQTNTSLAELKDRATGRLADADRDLSRITESTLSSNARQQLTSAKRFARLAKDAIEAKNFIYALYCADKAATLASLLVK